MLLRSLKLVYKIIPLGSLQDPVIIWLLPSFLCYWHSWEYIEEQQHPPLTVLTLDGGSCSLLFCTDMLSFVTSICVLLQRNTYVVVWNYFIHLHSRHTPKQMSSIFFVFVQKDFHHILTTMFFFHSDGPFGISKTTRAKAGQKTCVSFPSLTQWRTFGRKWCLLIL